MNVQNTQPESALWAGDIQERAALRQATNSGNILSQRTSEEAANISKISVDKQPEIDPFIADIYKVENIVVYNSKFQSHTLFHFDKGAIRDVLSKVLVPPSCKNCTYHRSILL